MKKRLLALVLSFCLLTPAALAFDDVPEDAWYAEAVDAAGGIFPCPNSAVFDPETVLRRIDAVSALSDFLPGGVCDRVELPFTDTDGLTPDQLGQLQKLHTRNIVTGDGARFYPNRAVTRQEFITLLHRLNQVFFLSSAEESNMIPAPDAQQIAPYAEHAVRWAYRSGMLTGGPDGALHPASPITRAEAAMLLYRYTTRETAPADSALDVPLLWPTPSCTVCASAYGWHTHPLTGLREFHLGEDIPAVYGADILAAADGMVTTAGWVSGYGNYTVIDHGGGVLTAYAHQSEILVWSGQTVTQGERIGRVGSTGNSTGPHLHFEVWVNGATIDPKSCFPDLFS